MTRVSSKCTSEQGLRFLVIARNLAPQAPAWQKELHG